MAIAGEVVNRRSVLLRNPVLNGKVSASNPLLHIHAKRYKQQPHPDNYKRNLMGLFSQSFTYYRIAKKALNEYSEPNDALITIMFSAMFLEAILNDTIAAENLVHELYITNNIDSEQLESYKYDFDIYLDQVAFYEKIRVLFQKNGKFDYQNDVEFIELKHLISIRNSIAHLKPIIQEKGGAPRHKISKSALNFLSNKKLVSKPFDTGVHWIDRVSNKEMAQWSMDVLEQSVEYFYNSTFRAPFGLSQLDFYCLKLSIGKYRK